MINFCKSNIFKNIIFIILCIFLIIFGLLVSHLRDYYITSLWLIMISSYMISAILLRKYLFIIVFFISSSILFPLSINPYTYYVIESGVIEKEINYGDNTIYFIKFYNGSTVTVLYGKNNQCFGKEYENKSSCHIIISMLENGEIHK